MAQGRLKREWRGTGDWHLSYEAGASSRLSSLGMRRCMMDDERRLMDDERWMRADGKDNENYSQNI